MLRRVTYTEVSGIMLLVRQLPEKQVGVANLTPTFLLTHESDRIFRAGRVCPFQEILGGCWNGRKNQNSEVWGGLRILGKDTREGLVSPALQAPL